MYATVPLVDEPAAFESDSASPAPLVALAFFARFAPEPPAPPGAARFGNEILVRLEAALEFPEAELVESFALEPKMSAIALRRAAAAAAEAAAEALPPPEPLPVAEAEASAA